MKKQFVFLFLLLALNSFTQSLDPTFGVNGIVNSQFSSVPLPDTCNASIIQPDGKTLICGSTNDIFQTTIKFIVRFNTDGTLDSSFGYNGIKYLSLGNSFGVEKMQLLANGKILLCSQYSLIRLNSNGFYDTTFGTNGITAIASLPSSNTIFNKSMTLQNDGKIITVGYGMYSTNRDFVLVRYNVDGTIDTTYGTNGIAQFNLGTNYDYAFEAATQTDDKIIVTGHTSTTGTTSFNDMVTIRVNTNGSLDTTFGNSGKVVYATSIISDSGRSVVIQPDGKIVVLVITNGHPAYFRYNTDGTLDTTLNGVGYKIDTINISGSGNPNSINFIKPKMVLLDSGKFIISGTSNGDFALKKINADGSNDLTFGTNGLSTYNFNTSDYSNFVNVTNTGSIYTGGYTFLSTNISKIVTLEFNENGAYVNSSFFNLKSSGDAIAKMIEQTNGKIVVLDEASDLNNYPNLTVRRYNSDGTPDNTFGIGGVVDTQKLGDIYGDCLIKLNDEKLAFSSMNNRYIYRITSDGVLDSTFGTNGLVDLSSIIISGSSLDEIKQGPDNKIYVAFDNALSNGILDFGILRLLDNGTIDTTFGTNGIFHTRFDYFNTADSNEAPSIMCFQSNGKLIVSGFLSDNTTTNVAIGILRINSNGTIDTSFGTAGKTIINPSTYYRNWPTTIICLNNDSFLLNASLQTYSTSISATLKFNANGSLDTSFGTSGYVYDLSYNNDMVLQTDGKILKGGENQNTHFSTTRYNTDGTIDISFGNNGYLNTPINNYSQINSLLLTQNGNLIAGGFSSTDRVTYATLVRYTNLNLAVLSFTKENSLLVYPNPIINETTFDYTLTNDSQISISLYDIEGKLMSEIAKDEVQSAGNHKLNINMSSFASGSYILKLTNNIGQHSIQLLKK